MRYFLRPVDSAGRPGKLIGAFVTLNINEEEISGYLTMPEFKADRALVVATYFPGKGWLIEAWDREVYYRDLEIEAHTPKVEV